MIFKLSFLLVFVGVIFTNGTKNFMSFKPNTLVKTYNTEIKFGPGATRIASMTKTTPLDAARMFVKTKLGFNSNDYVIKNHYTSDHNKITHVYLRQIMDNKEIFNADININVSEKGQVISYGDSFHRSNLPKTRSMAGRAKFPSKTIPANEAMKSLLKELNIATKGPLIQTLRSFNTRELKLRNIPGARQDAKAVQGWIQLENGKLEPVWDLQVDFQEDYYHAHISVNTKKPVSLVNWVSSASYNVVPFGINDPSEGKRKLVKDPEDKIASRLGWHSYGIKSTNSTGGNNVYSVTSTLVLGEAVPDVESSILKGDEDMKFDFPFDESKDPKTYLNASVTNIFYLTNKMHDLYYRYGFDEKAGNFQKNNFGLGGKGNDNLVTFVQQTIMYNNAFFACPPDGLKPFMYMYIFNNTNPNRDSGFDNGIIIHEYTHGLSFRLTGGPANSDCLVYGESGGLGEGWGDFIATMIRMNSTTKNASEFGLANYAMGSKNLRKHLYSTSMDTNPLTFEFIGRPEYQDPHATGEVWAETLFEVYWSLADFLPISDNWFISQSDIPKYANSLLLQLVIDGMKFQPCNPTFLNARDAILQAEKNYTKEKYKCALWAGFAKRGMGVDAKVVPYDGEKSHKNSFILPNDC